MNVGHSTYLVPLAITKAQHDRMVEKLGHPITGKPKHYAPKGAKGDGSPQASGQKAYGTRASVGLHDRPSKRGAAS